MDSARSNRKCSRRHAGAGRRNQESSDRFARVYELLALQFTEQVVNRVKADEGVVQQLLHSLSPREIVELILAIGFYMMMARLTETTRTDLDPPSGTKVIDSLRR